MGYDPDQWSQAWEQGASDYSARRAAEEARQEAEDDDRPPLLGIGDGPRVGTQSIDAYLPYSQQYGQSYLPTEGAGTAFPITADGYRSGAGPMLWGGYAASTRNRLSQQMVEYGLLDPAYGTEGMSSGNFQDQHDAWDTVLGVANYYGISPFNALSKIKTLSQAGVSGYGRSGGGGAGGIVTEIPDYASISQRSKDMFRQMVGRNPEDWELTLVADKMQEQFKSADTATRTARLSGNGTFEIPEPQQTTKSFIESQYGNELERQQDVESTSNTNKLVLQAATMGAKMVGGS
jgi:hypothetical protein